MSTQRPTHPIVATLLALATFLAPHAPLLHAQDGASVWLPLVHQGSAQVTTLPASDLLFRTQLTIHTSAQQARLTQLGVTVLAQRDERTTTLVDYAQLQILARLGYQPRNTVEFGALIAAGAPQKPWLVRSLQPLTQQLQAARATVTAAADQAATESQADTAALTALRSAVNSLSLAQRAAVNELPTLDFDGDGLTDTEESWWCTDPQNPNSDSDAQGYSDGQEVAALLDVTLSRTVRWNYGPPFGPPATWPDFNNKDGNSATPACNDGDFDTIPDYAEAYMVGTRVGAQDMENTDGDKFDDGQELFGVTYCPGAPNSCGWGNYPRTQDFSFISNAMPSWVRPPGDSPFVAAYPVIEFNVDPATIRITTKEIRTIEKTITEGTEIAEGFAETKGNSTSVGTIDTNTRNGWQEHSSSVGGIEPAQVNIKIDARDVSSSLNKTMFSPKFVDNTIESVCRLTADDLEFVLNPSEQEEEICIALHENYMSYTASIHSGTTSLVVLEIEIADASPDEEQWALLRYAHFEHNLNTFISNEPQILISRKQNEQWVFVEQSNYKKWLQIAPFSIARSMEQEAGISSDRQQGYRLPFQQKLGSVLVTQTEQAEGGCYPTIVQFGQPLLGCSHYGVNAYDFNLRDGHVILAAKDGVVGAVRMDSNRGCGSTTCAADANYIRIDRQSDDGSWISDWYLHLAYQSDPLWQVGQKINQGDPLGIAGSTGYSTGPHLHFDVRRYPSLPDSFGDYLRNYLSDNSLKIGFDEVRHDKSSCGNDQGKLLYINSQGGRCSYQSQQELVRFACYAPSISATGLAPNPAPTTSLKQKITNFFEGIGRAVNGWWGKTPGDSLQARSTASSVSGCSVNQSCPNQVSGRSSGPIDHSSNVSAGACGGSGGQTNSNTLGIGGGGSGLAYNDNGGGNFTALRTWSETTTTGEGWSTSHSDVRTETEYSEITRSTVNTLVSSEAWSTATTTDPTDAARLTFNYALANTGSDLAVQVTGLRANILIGDLPVITINLPDRTNLEPSKAKGPFGSDSIPLTLDQLAAIDNGAPIRVVLADYGYNDSLYDTNAWGRSVLFHVDDGIADGDEIFDTYLIATNLGQNETYQETMGRYFPVTVFEGGADDERTGTLTSITTPEYDAIGEITAWVKHPVNDHAWWELSISTGGETPGIKNFKAMPAKAKTDVYLRYMVDTDGDGYTDRTERDAGTDRNDPDSHPRPLLVAAKHTQVSGSKATVQLALQNLGDFDASSVEIWAIAPDDSITIEDNLIGGGGRVRAGRHVVLGARIGAPDLTGWVNSTAKPAPGGQFDGGAATTFQFRADTAGTVGSTAGLQVSWSIDGATWAPLNVGSGYTAWTPLPLRDGLSIAFSPGAIAAGETFHLATALPIDTFSYTINRTPYTPPLLVVSYNDAQGNHKFVADVETSQIQEELTRYYAEMRRGLQLDIRQAGPFQAGANHAWLTLYNPSDRTISGAKLVVEVVTPDGALAKQYVLPDQTFQPGPHVVTLDWNTADFNPAFAPNTEYHLLAYATDHQGTIIEHTLRSLDTLAKDALPVASFDATMWDFGTITQGEILEHTFVLANVGFADLQSRALLPAGLSMTGSTSRHSLPGDIADFTLTLDTRVLTTGPYSGTITLRTSDPAHPTYTIEVIGTIEPLVGDAYARAVVDRPLDVEVWVPGNRTQGEWITFAHPLGPQPQSLHPIKVYSQDGTTLYGVGRYATDFGAGTASYDMFGDGRDGVMPGSGNLNDEHGAAIGTVNGAQGSTTISVVDRVHASRINPGDVVLIHQTQGTGAGQWELNKAVLDFTGSGTFTLQEPLKYNYISNGGNEKAQILRVPQYSTCNVTGTVIPLDAWNGEWGGIFAVMCHSTMTIEGAVWAAGNNGAEAGGGSYPTPHKYAAGGIGTGFRGGQGDSVTCCYYTAQGQQGEGENGSGGIGTTPNGMGGGGSYMYDNGDPDGGGGANVTSGRYGWAGTTSGVVRGGDGGIEHIPTNNSLLLFGGGGGGGAKQGGNAGGGGAGGGIVVIIAAEIAVNGSVNVSGGNGGTTGRFQGGGGGGAGGSLLLRSRVMNIGSMQTTAAGGRGGSDEYGWGGGPGGIGRINIEYCESLTGTTDPPARTQKLNCHITEQVETPPYNTTQINLPETFNDSRTYRVQYGHRFTMTNSSEFTSTVRVPTGNWTAASLDALISGVGMGDITFKVDVGNDGVWDWEETRNVTNAATFANAQLAAAFAPYVTGSGPGDVPVDVPVKVYLSQPGQVLLTNFVIERNQVVDLTPSLTVAGTPTEGATVPLNTSIANRGAVDSGPVTVAYYATLRQAQGDAHNTPTYIGSTFIPNIPAGDSAPASFDWKTLGFTGPVTVTVAVDPFNRLSELDKSNNSATGQLTIRTRPDLMIAHVTLSNEEPLAGEPVDIIVDWQNGGETPTGNHKAALYQGNPADQGQLVQLTEIAGIDAKTNRSTTFTWTPPTPGHYRLFLQADGENQVNEFDESNNAHWLDLYVGMASPLTIDSGGDGDSSYSTGQGYGVVDEGSPDQTGNCGDAVHQTYRQDPSGQVIYRFDHLLPGHFYHLDVTLYECEQNAGRQQRVLIDGIAMAGPIDLGDGEIHRLSLLLDPALYADRTISVTVAVEGTGGALVNEIAVVDVDYRYADAGGATDVAYPTGRRAYGWLDGVAQKPWGTLPYQTLREDQQDNEVRYRFDGLDPQKAYQVHFSFYQRSGNHRVQQVWIDDRPVSSDLTIVAGTRSDHTVSVPIATYADGSIQVAVRRTDGATTGAMISEIALEELTQAVTISCQTATTPFFTSAYGQLTIDNQPAPVGTVVTAENLSGEIVGCFTVDTVGSYGFMTIYGADASAVPVIPGMKEGEQVIFRVNGITAKSTPALVWHDDKATHEITLAITNAPGQLILLKPGWNLFSFHVEPPVSLIDILLQPITGKYCKMLGERGIYDCNVPANFRSLKELQAGAGYYARIEGQTSVNLLINGVEQPADTPIALHPGLNWVGYLPAVTLPITTALQSIGEQLVQVADGQGHIYDPTKPTFSTLKMMTPGSGYLVYASAAVTLTYPAALSATTALQQQSESDLSGNSSCSAVSVTPYYTVLYGQLTQDGTSLPVGANVEAITPRGEIAGCGRVQVAGQYGFLTLFGAEQGATSGGFLVGETISLRVHEELITFPEPFLWRDDKSTHEVDVEIRSSQQVYLPLTMKQGQ